MEVTRIFDLLDHQNQNYPQSDALAKKENGEWIKFSTAEYIRYTDEFAAGLLAMGCSPGDKIAIIANNRPEWNFCDLGMQKVGVINVPIYPTISESDLQFIFNDAGIKYVFVSTRDLYDKVKSCSVGVASVQGVYTYDKYDDLPFWESILDKGKESDRSAEVKSIKDGIKPKDLATILYTSGTTGQPKGVMLCHDNLVSNFLAVRTCTPCDSTSRALSFLPLNHVYERMLTYFYMYIGVSIYYAESMETIGDNLREVKPHVFSCVPRLLEKVYDKIMAKGDDLTGIKRALFFWAVGLGKEYKMYGENGWWYEFKLKIANKIIFSKWREALGGNVIAAVSGGAALNPNLAKIFWAAGIRVCEGYGLTETSPVIAVNTVMQERGVMLGSVGPVIDGVEVRIADDGEIVVKGPNVMMGYYKRDDLTREMIDEDGWLHTGDIGEIVDNKFLKITDRKKEIFKTSGGKYIAPQMIENLLKESPFIEQAMVIGENKKFPSALIVPSWAYIEDWCKKKGHPAGEPAELIERKEILEKFKKSVSITNEGLAQYEKIKKFALLPTEWTIDGGQMTPKLSLKRKVILVENQQRIEDLYAALESAV